MALNDLEAGPRDPGGRQDRAAGILLLFFFSFCYAYFYQGGGWNQNSQFDTVRAIVERGTMEITGFAGNTGDIGTLHGRVYANKPPGLAFAGAPFYFLAYHLERGLGLDPAEIRTVTLNAHVLAFYTSGLPAVLLLLLLYRHFRRQGAAPRESVGLATAFGLGTLALPYSGVMVNHLLNACLLFGAWSLLTRTRLSHRAALLAGVLSGMAVVTESLAAPAAALFLVYAAWRHTRAVPAFLAGSALMLMALATHNYVCFGSPFATNNAIQAEIYNAPGQLWGMLDWPQPVRLFWLTLHPFRGLFFCCPVLLVSVLSSRRAPLTLESGIPLAIVAYHFVFNMSFNGWTGGWGIGPRYLIPAMPFLFSFALPGFRRFRLLSGVLAFFSAAAMLSVTAVLVMMPAPNQGPPLLLSPALWCLRRLLAGQVSISTQGILDLSPAQSGIWASYNLGELAGLRGLASLLPLIVAFLAFAHLAWHGLRRADAYSSPNSGRRARV